MTISAIVLAGGRGSRLGKEKHTVVIEGIKLIERVIAQASLLSNEIWIVFSQKRAKASASLYTYPGAKTVVDLYPGKGSLGGVYTGLVYSTNFINLVVACDMPFLNKDLLAYMVELSPGYDIVIPRIDHLMEPLHAIYSRNCLGPIENMLKENNLRSTDLLNSVKVRYVGKEEIDKFDPEHLSFFNINTQADL